jgi:hypothetical protein
MIFRAVIEPPPQPQRLRDQTSQFPVPPHGAHISMFDVLTNHRPKILIGQFHHTPQGSLLSISLCQHQLQLHLFENYIAFAFSLLLRG